MTDEKCCGTCKWHEYYDLGWRRANEESDACGAITDYYDDCGDWEAME